MDIENTGQITDLREGLCSVLVLFTLRQLSSEYRFTIQLDIEYGQPSISLGFPSVDIEGHLCSLYCTILWKGLEHLQILVCMGGTPGTNPLQILKGSCISLWNSRLGYHLLSS